MKHANNIGAIWLEIYLITGEWVQLLKIGKKKIAQQN